MTVPFESTENPYVANRRSERRQKVLFSSVVISENNCGRVLDISPRGLALQTDSALVTEEFPDFRFKFSPTLAWVSAKGRVVWKNESKNVVGIEFVGLTDEVQRQIQTWMDSKKDLSGIGAVIVGPTPVPASACETSTHVLSSAASHSFDSSTEVQVPLSTLPSLPPSSENQEIRREAVREHIPAGSSRAVWLVGLALVVVLVTLFVVQRFHPQKSASGRESTEIVRQLPPPAAAAVSEPSLPAPSMASAKRVAPAEGSPVPASNRRLSPSGAAFVVQAGAMVHQENANALAASLRELSFPAFVIKLPTDRFHYVFVGPYDSKNAAIETQNDLEQKGYKTFRREWKMPAR